MLKDSEHYTFRHQFDGKPGITLYYFVFRNLAKQYNHWEFSRGCCIRQFCVADSQKYCVSTTKTPMHALIRTLPIRLSTVTVVIHGNRRKRLLSLRGTSTLSISGALRVSTSRDKHKRHL